MKGVKQLSYNKNIWKRKDKITKEKLNHMEDGIYDAHDKIQDINSQIKDIANQMNNIFIDVTTPPHPLNGVILGETDSYSKIQDIINYVFENGGGTVYFPRGVYTISKPLLLPSDYQERVVNILGEDRNNTIILKNNNNVLNDGSEIGNIDSVLILTKTDEKHNGGYHQIKNIHINGCWDRNWETNYRPSNTEYGIYTDDNLSYLDFENLQVDANYSIFFNDAIWQSTFKQIRMHPYKGGIHFKNTSCTSNTLSGLYVMTCNASDGIAYLLKGTYSAGHNLAADGCSGNVYKFEFCDWTINGIGCEGCETADNIILLDHKANVVLTSASLEPSKKEGSTVFRTNNQCKLYVNSSSIGYRDNTTATPSRLYHNISSEITIDNLVTNWTLTGEDYCMLNVGGKVKINGINKLKEKIVLNGSEEWSLYYSDSSSNMITFKTTISSDNIYWVGLNSIPTFNVINAPVYTAKAKQKPSHFTNISTAIENDQKLLYYTVPSSCAWDLQSFKNLLNLSNLIIEVDFK